MDGDIQDGEIGDGCKNAGSLVDNDLNGSDGDNRNDNDNVKVGDGCKNASSLEDNDLNGSDGDNGNDNGDVKVGDCDKTDDSDGGVKDVEGTTV